MPNLSFSTVKIEGSVIHQIIRILQDKSMGSLKITYGYHPWSQECPPTIKKALSGTFIILYFLEIQIGVVYTFFIFLLGKSNGE